MNRPLCHCCGNPMRKNGRQKNGNLKWRCAEKKRVYHRHWQEFENNDRRMLVSLANRHGCEHCGLKENLHRHHIDPTTKRFSVAEAIGTGSVKFTNGIRRNVPFGLFYDELVNHTIALCAPCHRKEHSIMRSRFSDTAT